MTTSALFWDRMAVRYSKRPISNQQAYERKLEITRSYFTPESEILEFGCGTGSTAILHAPHVSKIDAIDISQKMLGIAQDKAEKANANNITFKKSSIDEFDGASESYDMVMAHSVLHLLPNRRAALKKAYSLLKPGGVFVSSTYCGRGHMTFLRPFLALGAMIGLLPKVSFFSPESLQMSVKDAGFRLDHVWQPENSQAMFIVGRKPKG